MSEASTNSSGCQAWLGWGEWAPQPQASPSQEGDPPESLSFRSVGLGHCAHSCEEFMVTHGCPGCWTGTGVERGILILYKLPLICLLSEAKIHFYSKAIWSTLKSSRLTRYPRLPNGLISGVNGKAQRESRHYQKENLMEFFFSPKENAIERH